MDRDEAALHAWQMAHLLWDRIVGQQAQFYQLIGEPAAEFAMYKRLAEFLDISPEATAEVLYRHAVGNRIRQQPWEAARRELCVCLEIYRATYLALMRLVRADEAAAKAAVTKPKPQAPLADRGIGRRAMRKRASMGTRVRLVPMAAPAPKPVETPEPATPAVKSKKRR